MDCVVKRSNSRKNGEHLRPAGAPISLGTDCIPIGSFSKSSGMLQVQEALRSIAINSVEPLKASREEDAAIPPYQFHFLVLFAPTPQKIGLKSWCGNFQI